MSSLELELNTERKTMKFFDIHPVTRAGNESVLSWGILGSSLLLVGALCLLSSCVCVKHMHHSRAGFWLAGCCNWSTYVPGGHDLKFLMYHDEYNDKDSAITYHKPTETKTSSLENGVVLENDLRTLPISKLSEFHGMFFHKRRVAIKHPKKL